MLVSIDLHVHTKHSGTSSITIDQLVEAAQERNVTHAAVTDSGSTQGVVELYEADGVGVLPGLELSTEEGHFLLFSEDLDFLDSFFGYTRSIGDLPRRDDLAVVWAHPWGYTPDGSRRAPYADEPKTEQVLPHIHALEVFNGNMALHMGGEMLSKSYVRDIITLARDSGKAMVGGSDTHTLDRFFKCWTDIQLPDGSAETADLIQAIRAGRTKPGTSASQLLPYTTAVDR